MKKVPLFRVLPNTAIEVKQMEGNIKVGISADGVSGMEILWEIMS